VSIDLYLDLTHPVSLRPLLPKPGAVLAEMLGLASAPELTLHAFEDGQRKAVASDELHDELSTQYLISIQGEPETVGLSVPGKQVTVTMGAQRDSLEYILGAAIAIALARELGGGAIGNDWHHFGAEGKVFPEDLLLRLYAGGDGLDYREAAEQLGEKLGWEPD
jgi:hypothetical protein